MSEGEEVVTEPAESEHAAEVPEIPEAIPEAIPTVVVGKKKVKKVEVQKLAEPPEAPAEPEVEKTKPSASKLASQRQRPSRARASTKPPPTPEPGASQGSLAGRVPEPTPAPKKAVRMKKTAPLETTLEPYAEPASSTRLLTDLNDFSARIQELHRMNEQHRKNVYRELIGGMV